VEELSSIVSDARGPEWFVNLRNAAMSKFNDSEWPRTSEEEWRRTNLSPFEFETYNALTAESFVETSAVDAVAIDVPRSGLLRYLNGSLHLAEIDQKAAEQGVVVADLMTLATDHSVQSIVKKQLESLLASADNRLQYWNIALAQGVAVIYVPRNVSVDQPIEIDCRVEGDEVVVAPITVVVAESGAQVHVIRRISNSSEEGEVLVVDGESLYSGDNARLSYVLIQRLNDESLYFMNADGELSRDARMHRTDSALGADFVKSRFVCALTGAGSDAVVNGLYFGQDEQHMDVRTVQKHRASNAMSRAYYRGAVRDEAHAIYQGLIDVAAKAPGTDAYLTNKNLILTEAARADSIPSLNINTDDVRCSHGSTTGKLDEGQIYYLQTRGYSKREATRTLVEGYFEDLIAQVPEDLRDEFRELISERIP
jgi:Fe-S cluster assembly protein SufD